MKYYLLLILGIILSLNSYSQKKWSFGAEFFPNFSIVSKKSTNRFAWDGSSKGDYKKSLSFRATAIGEIKGPLSLYLGVGGQFTGEKIYRTLYYFD